jgi:hypothetical protein
MKNYFRALTTACVLLIFCNACVDELDYIPGESDPQIVVNCLFADGEPFKVYISTSFSPYLDAKPKVIKEAVVEIFENNISLGFLAFEKQYYYILRVSEPQPLDSCFTNQNIVPKAENTYRIEVSVPGYKKITATSRIPTKIITKPIIFNTQQEIRENYIYSYNFYKFGFTDPPEANYYHISTISYNPFPSNAGNFYVEVPLFSKDPVIEEANTYNNLYNIMMYSFSDWRFNGKDYDFEFEIGDSNLRYSGDTLDVFISLNNTSKEFEYYIKSLMASMKNKDNFLAEPLPIFTNIVNGLGIFAGYSHNVEKITFIRPAKNY